MTADHTANNPKLAVVKLRASYFTDNGVINAADDVSFTLLRGESMGIAGESGCGKSTLGSALLRSLQPPGRIVSGKIVIDGQNITDLSNSQFDKTIRWKKIAMIFQGAMNSLDPVYTIYDQMEEILKVHGTHKDIGVKIYNSLQQVGLEPSVAKRYPHELSGGMKQRVIIAMALMLDPEIVIADEPTTALDVLVQAQIINLLKRLKADNKMTIILITHDLAITSELADKVGVMYAGQIVEFGSAFEIYQTPKHPYTQALISSIPSLRLKKELRSIPGSPPDMLNLSEGCRFYSRCPHAMDVCKKDPPEFSTSTGYVRCWLYK